VSGKMLWFNGVRRQTGERVLVNRSAFVDGAPGGRCRGREREFTAVTSQDGWVVGAASLVTHPQPSSSDPPQRLRFSRDEAAV
jgi:hypothetical protein